jgi:hypothetical protein
LVVVVYHFHRLIFCLQLCCCRLVVSLSICAKVIMMLIGETNNKTYP